MEIPISSFGALESKPVGESTKSSTPEAQKSTDLKSELWFFHSELGIFRAHNQPKVFIGCLVIFSFFNKPDLERVFHFENNKPGKEGPA
jgi:hypothetical protein